MLTDSIIKKAPPAEKQYKLRDGNSLYLLVYPTGGKAWRYRYIFQGKENMVSLGTYPDVSLDEARKRLAAARTIRSNGINPSKHKQALKQEAVISQENTFELVAREWYENRKSGWKPNYTKEILRRLEFDLLPSLGARPVKEIEPLDFLEVLRKVEGRDALTVAKRCHQIGGRIFRYAVVTGRVKHDVTADIRDALRGSPPVQHHNRLESHDLPEFMAKFNRHKTKPLTRLAMRLLILTFVRSRELREATWDEIHWEKKQWIIPAERMKMKNSHIVPLSRQAMDVLRQIHKISGHTPFLFPGSSKPQVTMRNSILLNVLYRMGYYARTTIHGFRATAATALGEMGFREKVIEIQLSHVEPNQSKKPYQGARYLSEREYMMQHYADFLDAMGEEGNKLTTNDFKIR